MEVVRLSVRQLVEFLLQRGDIDTRFTGFDRANEGARIHRKLQKAAGEGYAAEVALAANCDLGGIACRIEGRADGIFTDEDGTVTIDEIKTTAVPTEHITEELNPCHWAQGMVYAAIYAGQHSLPAARVRLTYYQIDTDAITRFQRDFTAAQLEAFWADLLAQYTPWAQRQQQWGQRRSAALQALPFPYPAYRAGQRGLAGEVYHACKNGGRLFCQAPTGIGKTMSTLFPALRAMGEGCGEKIFYLTARATTRAAAEDALALLHRQNPGLALKGITLTAKDKICLCKNEAGRPECNPDACPYAKGYYDRVRAALTDLLDNAHLYPREALTAAAEKHRVCPFELGLDLSEWCDVVVGDYNYLFDPVVFLRRFFDAPGDWLFLIDEAHNLPGRAREMYSATFRKGQLLEARRALGKQNSRLKTALGKADRTLLAYRKLCQSLCRAEEAPDEASFAGQQLTLATPEEAPRKEEAPSATQLLGEQAPLYAKGSSVYLKQLPAPLLQALSRLAPPLEAWLEEHRADPAHEQLLQLYFDLRAFTRTAEGYDAHYVTQLTAHGSELQIELQCLDPSTFVDKALSLGRAGVLFSATLAPAGYYKTVLGCGDARAIALPSPFPQGHLGIWQVNLSTRYNHRAASLAPLADWLAALCSGKVGNYLVFFPSYTYLRQALEVFTEKYPAIRTLAQESGLDDAARAAFLARFAPDPAETLLGFGVLGGIFGEGVDLVGSRLIGCAVVGVGLPQLNPGQEMLRRYYDEAEGCGYDYAYRYPGMNKVLQAAGRVIRTAEDRGVVLLLDDRFLRPDTARLLPAHWAHRRLVHQPEALRQELRQFWAASPTP